MQADSNKTKELFGPNLPSLSCEEYVNLYTTTGVDIDGRRERIKCVFPGIEKALVRYTDFAKKVPGFRDIELSDQMELIKGNIYLQINFNLSEFVL